MIQLKPEGLRIGPRIRHTARKSVPVKFQKFSFKYPIAARDLKGESPFNLYNPCGSTLQIREDPSLVEAQSVTHKTHNSWIIPGARPTFFQWVSDRAPYPNSVRGSTCPSLNWVWTRNPNLGFSSLSETRFGPFKRHYNQYSEEHYLGGYPNPHFRYKRFQKVESSQSNQGFCQAYPHRNPYKYQGRYYCP